MPIVGSHGSLSKDGFSSVTTNLNYNQYICTINSLISPSWDTSTSGNLYIANQYTNGLIKLDTNGNILFQKEGSYYGSYVNLKVDSNENIFIANDENIVKQNSNGNILWQKTTSVGTDYCSSVAVDNLGNVFVLHNTYGSVPSVLVKIDGNGNVINQKNVFGSAAAGNSLMTNFTNNTITVAGTTITGNIKSYLDSYSITNTGSGSILISNIAGGANSVSCVDGMAQGIFISNSRYVIDKRTVSSITHTTLNGVTFSYGGIELNLAGICKDDYNYCYILGLSSANAYVFKFIANTSAILWAKRIYTIPFTTWSKGPISWANGYVHFGLIRSGTPTYTAFFKLADNGILPNGTYQSLYVIESVNLTTGNIAASSTGSADTPSNGTLTYSNSSLTLANTSLTSTTTAIP